MGALRHVKKSLRNSPTATYRWVWFSINVSKSLSCEKAAIRVRRVRECDWFHCGYSQKVNCSASLRRLTQYPKFQIRENHSGAYRPAQDPSSLWLLSTMTVC